MKKSLGIIGLILISFVLNGQKSVDALFEKYAGKDGFVTVTINGNLLKLAAALDNDNDGDDNSLPKEITQIRILTQDDEGNRIENFNDLFIKDLDLTKYEEFMKIKKSDQDVRMLVLTEGNKFKEFLLIVGGNDNAIIQIKGDMTLVEAKKFADDAKRDHGVNIIEKHQ